MTTTNLILGAFLIALSLGQSVCAAPLNANSSFEHRKHGAQLESLDPKARGYYAGTTDSPFEGWTFGGKWESGDYALAVSDRAHSGEHSAQITCARKGRGGLAAGPVVVKSGQVIQVSVWLRAEDAIGGRVFLNFEGSPGDGWASKELKTGSYDWTRFSQRAVVPGGSGSGEQTVVVFLYTTCEGTLWVDDLTVEILEAAALTNKLEGPAGLSRTAQPIPEPQGSLGYRVRAVPALEKIYREDDYAPEGKSSVEVFAARNEYESVQLVVEAPWRTVRINEVLLSELQGPNGAVIAASALRWDRVDYVQTTIAPPYFAERGAGWYPDPLMPAGPFVVDQLSRTPIWVTLKTPQDCPAGEYRGTITIVPDNLKPTVLPITLTLWDFALTDETHLRTMTWLGAGTLRTFYGNDWSAEGEKRQAETVGNYEDFLLRHRLGPGGDCVSRVGRGKDGQYDFRAVDAKLERLLGQGMNAFVMGSAPNLRREHKSEYTPEFLQEFTERIKAYGEHLRERGWLDRAYVYVYDEAPKAAWPEVKRIDAVIRQAAPGLKIFQCLNEPQGVQALTGYADVFDVYVAQYHKSGVASSQQRGAEVWLATCCYPLDHPNFFLEYPLLDLRVTPWICWKYRVAGYEYWSTTAWGANASSKGARWPKVPWVCHTFGRYNGDGHLLYPGADRKPYSSIRLEALRDGLEDYEYLWTLRDLLRRAAAAKCQGAAVDQSRRLLSLEGVVKENGSYFPQAEKYLAYRQRLAHAIVELQAIAAKK